MGRALQNVVYEIIQILLLILFSQSAHFTFEPTDCETGFASSHLLDTNDLSHSIYIPYSSFNKSTSLGNEIVLEAFSIPLCAVPHAQLRLNALIAPEINVWQPIFILLPLGGGRSRAPCRYFLVRTSVLSYAVTIDRDLAVKIKDASCRDSVLKIKDMLKSSNPFESCNDDACYSLNASDSEMKDQDANNDIIKDMLESLNLFESCHDGAYDSLHASDSEMKDQNPLFIASFLEACVPFDPGGVAISPTLGKQTVGMQTADNHSLVSRDSETASDKEILDICPTLVHFVATLEQQFLTIDDLLAEEAVDPFMDDATAKDIVAAHVSFDKTPLFDLALTSAHHSTLEPIVSAPMMIEPCIDSLQCIDGDDEFCATTEKEHGCR